MDVFCAAGLICDVCKFVMFVEAAQIVTTIILSISINMVYDVGLLASLCKIYHAM